MSCSCRLGFQMFVPCPCPIELIINTQSRIKVQATFYRKLGKKDVHILKALIILKDLTKLLTKIVLKEKWRSLAYNSKNLKFCIKGGGENSTYLTNVKEYISPMICN